MIVSSFCCNSASKSFLGVIVLFDSGGTEVVKINEHIADMSSVRMGSLFKS